MSHPAKTNRDFPSFSLETTRVMLSAMKVAESGGGLGWGVGGIMPDESDRSGRLCRCQGPVSERRQAVRLRGVLGAEGGVKVNEQTGWPVVALSQFVIDFRSASIIR